MFYSTLEFLRRTADFPRTMQVQSKQLLVTHTDTDHGVGHASRSSPSPSPSSFRSLDGDTCQDCVFFSVRTIPTLHRVILPSRR